MGNVGFVGLVMRLISSAGSTPTLHVRDAQGANEVLNDYIKVYFVFRGEVGRGGRQCIKCIAIFQVKSS